MKLPALRVIDRYILSELVSPFCFGVTLFTLFLLLDRIYHLAELVIAKGVPLSLVLQLVLLMLPSFLSQTLPMALLTAVLLGGGRLAGDLEIIAFKASGVSLLRLFRPIIGAALIVTVFTGALTLAVNPRANEGFQRQLFRILQANVVSGLEERVFNTRLGDVVIYVESMSDSRVVLRGMLVSDERDPTISRIITAREGRMLTDPIKRRITLRLLNGAVNEADVVPALPASLPGVERGTGGSAAEASRYRHTKFDVYDLSLPLELALKAGARFEKPETNLRLSALIARIGALASDPHGRVPYLVELHKRFAFPVAALVFALIAFPLAVRSHRGGRAIAVAGSLVLLVSYYLIMTSLEGMALAQRIPVWVAIWAPNVAFGASGVALLVATTREWRPARIALAWKVGAMFRGRLPGRRRADHHDGVAAAGRDSTHILDRYVIREFFIFIGIGLAVAATLFVVVDLIQTLDRYLRVKPPLIYILEHFVYRLPAALYDGLPVVVLVATIFLFLALNRFHELTAMKAAGISLYRVSAPILLAALSVALSAMLFQELLLPQFNELGEEVDRVKVRGQQPRHLQLQQRLWVRSGDSRFYRIELLDPPSNNIYGLTLLEIDKHFKLLARLDARQAQWTAAGWQLFDGVFREVLPTGSVDTVPFTATALELGDNIEEFTRFQKPVELMNYRELRDYVTKLEGAGFEAKRYLADLYSKLSFPLVNLVMVLVAIPLSLQSPRSGRLFGVGLAVAIMAGYLVIHYAALAFARANFLPPLVAAWTANIIFFGIGTALFMRART